MLIPIDLKTCNPCIHTIRNAVEIVDLAKLYWLAIFIAHTSFLYLPIISILKSTAVYITFPFSLLPVATAVFL